MMPLLPYISDDEKSLHNMYAAFANAGAQYIMPAGITLFGSGTHDSKTLTLNAVAEHYPEHLGKYRSLFGYGFGLPKPYAAKLETKTKALNQSFSIPDRIIRL